MKVNHLNLTVKDVVATRAFLNKYFGLQVMPGTEESKGIGFLTDDNGMVLSLIKAGHGITAEYPSTFHVGFIQESKARVNEINQRLKDDGYDVPPPSEQHGSWTFYFESPGGFTIEVLS